MNRTDFDRAVDAFRREFAPAVARNASGMAIDCDHYLRKLPGIVGVMVTERPHDAWQVRATCRPAPRALPVDQYAASLLALWVHRLAYRGHEVHCLIDTRRSVVREAVTWSPNPYSLRKGIGRTPGSPYSTTVRIEVSHGEPNHAERPDPTRDARENTEG